MPSLLHEILVALFRNRPTLAAEILRGPLGLDVPSFQRAQIEESALTTMTPTSFAADLVVTLQRDKAVLGIVVEVQLAVDKSKPASWLAYLANLYAKIEAPVALLVIATSDRVAKWCARPLTYGPGEFRMCPFVLGPSEVPIVTDRDAANEAPELAVLSALAHSQGPYAFDVGRAALHAASYLDNDRSRLYSDLILAKSAARRELEEMLMIPANYKPQSDLFKRWYAEGLEQGLEQGLEEGRERGREEGRQRGRLEAKAEALLVLLQARGLFLNEATSAKVRECADIEILDAWFRRAATATTIDEVFDI